MIRDYCNKESCDIFLEIGSNTGIESIIYSKKWKSKVMLQALKTTLESIGITGVVPGALTIKAVNAVLRY